MSNNLDTKEKLNGLSNNFDNNYDTGENKKRSKKINGEIKKRKRKFDDVQNDNEPKLKKIADNFEVNHVTADSNTDNDPEKPPENHDEITSEPEETEKEVISPEDHNLTAKDFRMSFNSDTALADLKKFVALSEASSGKILAEYLDSNGNVMEILRMLEGLDKKHLNNVALVFNAASLLIMRIIAAHPQQQPSTIQACRYILNTHISLLHSLMSNAATPRQRKIALKLLTSIVMLGDSLPRDLLTHLSFHNQTVKLLAQQTKPSDPESVRVCFINFILAFLIDSEPWTVRCLLEKRDLLPSILPELTYDRAHIVHLVLNVLKKYLLENPAISKTQKFHLFTSEVIKSIVSLYNYQGPKSWPGAGRKSKNLSDPLPQDKEIVVSATHEFLITLLTSARHGIIFTDRNLGTRGNHNERVATVIKSLNQPWNHSRPRELVTRILGSCPDLIKLVLVSCEPYFEPPVVNESNSSKWINAVSFYRDILALDLDPFKKFLPDLSIPQCINVSLTLAMPLNVLRTAISPAIASKDLVVKQQGLLTLSAMLTKLRDLFAIIETHFPAQEAANYRVSIQNYLTKHLPPVESILKTWNDDKTQDLDVVLNVIENYREVCNLDSAENLSGTKIEHDFEGDDVELRVRVIEVNYWLDPTAYAVNEKLFSDCLVFLIKFVEVEGSQTPTRLIKTLRSILSSLEPFKNCPDHLDIWIQSLSMLTTPQRVELATWLVHLLRKMAKCPAKYMNILKDAEKALKKRDKNLKAEKSEVPIVFVAAINSLRESFDENVNIFLGYVTILTLHSLQDARILGKVVENTDSRTKYLEGWLEGRVQKIKKYFPCKLMARLSKIVLGKEEIVLENLDDLEVTTDFEKENLFRMVLFYFTHLVKMSYEIGARNCKVALLWLLKQQKASMEPIGDGVGTRELDTEIANELEVFQVSTDSESKVPTLFHKFANLFTGHLTVLGNFSFLSTDTFSETFVSIDCFDIFALVSSNASAYKEKLVSDLSTGIDDKFRNKKIIDRIEYFDIFEFSTQEIHDLLSRIIDLKTGKFYSDALTTLGKLVGKLFEILADKCLDFDHTNLVMRFWSHLGELKTKGIDTSAWEIPILKFLKKNPVEIDVDHFKKILKDLRNPTIELVNLLLKQNGELLAPLSKFLLKEQYKKPEILFPLLSANLEHKWNPKLLDAIFANYVPAILSYFDGVECPWIDQFSSSAGFLIANNFTQQQCQQIADKLLQSREKLESINSNYLALVSEVWKKRAEFESPVDTVEEYLQILLPIAVSALKKVKKEPGKLNIVICCMDKALDKLDSLKSKEYLFEKIIMNNSFKQFVNYSLKYGLKIDVSKSKTDILNSDLDNLKTDSSNLANDVSILEILSKLLNLTYSDKSTDNYIEQIYEMIRTNPNFDEILLTKSKSSTKTSLLQLFLTMCRKVPGKIHSDDLKLLMCAYNATLNPADQLILMIIQFYESSGLHLDTHALLWGQAAVNYSSGNIDTALWRQITGGQILDLLDPEIVARTVRFYPVDRGLKSLTVLEFENGDIYDPAFYLPLLVTLSTTDKLVPTHKLVKSGAMALVLSSCSSDLPDVRLAAFLALSQFHYHFDAAKNKDKLLWIRCIDALRNGVAQLMTPEAKLETVRLSSLITTFLARASLISAKEGNIMFAPIQGYFTAKQAMDLKVIPEFLTLFHSADVNHKIYRHWMLECVRDGLKCYDDMKLAFRMGIFKMVMDFYGCVLADNETKVIILQIIESAVKIPRSNPILIKNYSLFNWLHELSAKIDHRNRQVVSTLDNIIKHLSIFKFNTKDNTLVEDHCKFMILMIQKTMKDSLSKSF